MLRVSQSLVFAASLALLAPTSLAHLSTGPGSGGPGAGPGVALPEAPPIDPAILARYAWRNAGPDRGGRSIAVSGVKGRPQEGYFGATGGGLWKTTDGGTSWSPVTDGQLTTSSVGAVAVSETNPDIVVIGTGESCIRGNIEPGDGVYKSTDAGKTWTHIGFSGSDAISRIRIDPTNPDIIYVADFGKYSVPSEERGVYKTTDGGKTWRRVLFHDAQTGAVDISIDPHNPQVLYAALWEAYRKEYQMSSGGPGSGLYKSTDGGEHWTEITRNPGLPTGVNGKIGVAVSGADGNRVYTLIENENGGLFRSNDGGATWALVNDSRNIRQRAFYFTHVFTDPKNADGVYLLNVSSYRSTDGGKTLQGLGGSHSDSHDLWIDPDNTQHMLIGNDGGGAITMAGGQGWSSEAYPTAQLYHVAGTAKIPPDLCGAQQDASTICVPFGSPAGARGAGAGGGRGAGGGGAGRGGRGGNAGGAPVTYGAGGAEPGYIAPDPKDPDIFYAGGNNGSFLTRLNRRTGEEAEVSPYPRMFSGEESSILVERWQWTYPIIFSPVNPTVLYTGSQHLWRTTNGGQSWQKISPDLTRHDPKTMGPSGGPITRDMNGPEVYAVIYAIGPSKRTTNVIWTGSDDGQVHVTKDAGQTWANVTPPGMPDFGRVSIIDASAFDSASAYVAVKRPLLDDRAPYIFRTHDFGKTWTKIVTGIRADDYVHSVREDPTRRGLLYAGTEHGFYISYDDGDHWYSLSLNLPDVQVSDIEVENDAISISTMGRSFYVLDDVTPLRQYTPAMTSATDVVLFAPPAAIRSAGGASIEYWVKKPVQSLTIDVLDGKGAVVHSFAPAAAGGRGGGGGGRGGRGGGGGAPATTVGFNTVTWNLQYPAASSFPGMILWGGGTAGPMAAPGTYTVRLTADGRTMSQHFVVKRNPLHSASDADLHEQFDLAIQIRDKVTEANDGVIQIRAIKSAVADRETKSSDPQLKTAGDKLTADLSAVEGEIYQVKNQSGEDPLNFPIKVNNRLASLLEVVDRTDMKPIANAAPIFRDLTADLKVQTDRLKGVLATDLPAFNVQAKRVGVDVVSAKQ